MKEISSSIHSAKSCGTSQSHDQTVLPQVDMNGFPHAAGRSEGGDLWSLSAWVPCINMPPRTVYKLKRIHCLIRYSVSEFIERSWASRFACTFVESELELTVQKESCISRGQLTLGEIQLADFLCLSCRKIDFNWDNNFSSRFTMSYISYNEQGLRKNTVKV
jgi:hypothetical protein